jgi:HAD superfamily hydrolase (TIGR01509 family)
VIRGIIFDFDGTILDTETPSYQTWLEVFDAHGCTFPLLDWSAGLGSNGAGFDSFDHLEAQLGRPVDREAIRARRRQRTLELIAACEALPGVAAYLETAEQLGLRRGIASSSPRAWVEEHLARLGLLHHFEVLSCAEDVARVKPDPALYLRTRALLGLECEETIVIEDSPNGVRAARAAGLFCVAVPNPVTGRLSLAHADLRLTSLADLSLDDLLRQVEAIGRGGVSHGGWE